MSDRNDSPQGGQPRAGVPAQPIGRRLYADHPRRAVWDTVWAVMFRPSPRVVHCWRRFLLRLFGARIGKGARIDPSCRVWAPWNLEMGDDAALGPHVDCYCVAKITLGERAIVSQYSYLCSASHDYRYWPMPTVAAPITIQPQAWVCADVYVAPGVTVGEGAVVGARSSVFKDVEPWTIVAGSPAKFIKKRQMSDDVPSSPAEGTATG